MCNDCPAIDPMRNTFGADDSKDSVYLGDGIIDIERDMMLGWKKP